MWCRLGCRTRWDTILSQLNLTFYIDDIVGETTAAACEEPELQKSIEKLLFAGADRAALLDLAQRLAVASLRAIGQRAVRQLTGDRVADLEPELSVEAPAASAPPVRAATPAKRRARKSGKAKSRA
jgi:electron transfer flavoprotein alpha/beta subunit